MIMIQLHLAGTGDVIYLNPMAIVWLRASRNKEGAIVGSEIYIQDRAEPLDVTEHPDRIFSRGNLVQPVGMPASRPM